VFNLEKYLNEQGYIFEDYAVQENIWDQSPDAHMGDVKYDYKHFASQKGKVGHMIAHFVEPKVVHVRINYLFR